MVVEDGGCLVTDGTVDYRTVFFFWWLDLRFAGIFFFSDRVLL